MKQWPGDRIGPSSFSLQDIAYTPPSLPLPSYLPITLHSTQLHLLHKGFPLTIVVPYSSTLIELSSCPERPFCAFVLAFYITSYILSLSYLISVQFSVAPEVLVSLSTFSWLMYLVARMFIYHVSSTANAISDYKRSCSRHQLNSVKK